MSRAPAGALPAAHAWLRVAVLGCALGASACGGRVVETRWAPPARAELADVHARLDAVRAELGPRTEEVRMVLEAPLLPGDIRARGAVAAVPGRALRMIVVGPGGSTAADLWMDAESHRIALPARDEVVRGARGEAAPFVPVDLLRAWFLEPLAGEVLDARVDGGGAWALLRTRDALVEVTLPADGSVALERRRRGAPGTHHGEDDVERIRAASGARCGTVTYERPRTGVRATITCEARRGDVAERALVDPDRPAGAPAGAARGGEGP